MKTFCVSLFLLVAVCTHPALGDTTTRWKGAANIQFSGTSTLHAWSGKVSAEPFVTTVVLDDHGQPNAVKATVEIKAANMDTAEPQRDVNMHSDMRVSDFPLITGAFDAAFQGLRNGGKNPVHLPFTLTLLGKQQAVDATLSHWSLQDGAASFDLDFDLSLKKSNIVVPAVLFVIRVGDAIHLHASVKLTKTTP